MPTKSSLNIKRDIWRWAYRAEYQLEASLSPITLPTLVDTSLRFLLPQQIYSDAAIVDLKGRDDELVFIAGRIFTSEEEELDKDIYEPFQVSIVTSFDSFVGAHHIQHRINIQRSGPLPESVSTRDIGRVFPLEIEHFRLGMELFNSNFVSGLLGFAPVVTERLTIDASQQELKVTIVAEQLKQKNDLPLAKDELLVKLTKILTESMNFDLSADYHSCLNKQLL